MQQCSFCGKPENEVKSLVSNGRACVCNKCVRSLSDIFEKSESKAEHVFEKEFISPKRIKAGIDQDVIGQDRAKVDASIAIYNHYKRREYLQKNGSDGLIIQKSNMLLLGPSGTGKTEIVRSISKMLNVPMYITDATKLTQAGYVGDDVESMLQGLLLSADNNLERAQWGIIFIDEIDKISRTTGRSATGYRDVSGEGVQQALLKMIEGHKLKVPPNMQRVLPDSNAPLMDTSNILFICSGSFEGGLAEIVAKRIESKKIGFGAKSQSGGLSKRQVYELVTEEDLLDFGIIPELLGRLPVLTSTYPLTELEMVAILTEPRNALIKQQKALFLMDAIELHFEQEALLEIGRKATLKATGARALRTILEDLLEFYSYEYRGEESSVSSITFTKEAVQGTQKAIIKTERNNSVKISI